ncbi:hypothetical protein ACEWPM_003100 [Roseovarius sp. S4756]|uniref:hypothetical protein n=1 Tax=Roseovarius maritimus TaxID=3342637 RepID=UPI00372691A6
MTKPKSTLFLGGSVAALMTVSSAAFAQTISDDVAFESDTARSSANVAGGQVVVDRVICHRRCDRA